MNRIATLITGTLMATALLGLPGQARAQCSDKTIKTATKQGLGNYIFESAAFKPLSAFNTSRGTVEAAFSVYSQESYRVINLCQGFSEMPEFTIYDSEKNALFSSSRNKGTTAYDFVAQKSGDYSIQFKIPAADQKNGSACVAFAIGYK